MVGAVLALFGVVHVQVAKAPLDRQGASITR